MAVDRATGEPRHRTALTGAVMQAHWSAPIDPQGHCKSLPLRVDSRAGALHMRRYADWLFPASRIRFDPRCSVRRAHFAADVARRVIFLATCRIGDDAVRSRGTAHCDRSPIPHRGARRAWRDDFGGPSSASDVQGACDALPLARWTRRRRAGMSPSGARSQEHGRDLPREARQLPRRVQALMAGDATTAPGARIDRR